MAVCSATETEPEKFPPFGVMVGVATVNAIPAVMLSANDVVFVTPPPVPETVIE